MTPINRLGTRPPVASVKTSMSAFQAPARSLDAYLSPLLRFSSYELKNKNE